MGAEMNFPAKFAEPAWPRWGAFRHPSFTVIWTASIVLNIGNAMFDTSSAWLMTSLNADPMAVSLVQVATALPVVLFTLPAGVLADTIDSRRLLIAVQVSGAALMAILATLTSLSRVTPAGLLLAIFLSSASLSLGAPAWLSITPLLVRRRELDGAAAANGVGHNIGRAAGPTLGGLAIGALGIAGPFWIACAACLVAVAALLWWRPPARRLPSERFSVAVRAGLRYAAGSRHLRATSMRGVAFFIFASASWALLPLVARNQIAQGPICYGVLMSAIGAGAIGGSLALNSLRRGLRPDGILVLATIGAALALVLFAVARAPVLAASASLIAGASSAMVLASLYASLQISLPEHLRARGLAIFLSAFFAALTLGSLVWGRIAAMGGLPLAYFLAAAGILLAIPLARRWKLIRVAEFDPVQATPTLSSVGLTLDPNEPRGWRSI
ncbi:MAG: MFS transporter [Roseiarcus sp.]